ncbi:MAG: hypothetical protein A3F72_18830 [Bacteroidetes bacterium RIFCSPLOWO2_12_FULL_35_15]|nr:MAG: hypothetical protein A3F72_18830 [Bacteroidetes bacterium RIFCSPLOWO2_12_FULL_35_15]
MVSLSIFFAFSLIGIIIGGLATLVTLIFTILALVAGKNENAAYWAIGFAISISVVIFSVVQMAERVSNKVKSGVEWLKEHENTSFTTEDDQLDYSRSERDNLMDTLKLFVDNRYKNVIPFSFYQDKGLDSDTLPFIYPYAFEYKDYNFNLVNVLQKNSIPMVGHISQLAYDNQYLLLKVDKTNMELKNNEPEISYFLIDLKSGKQTQFLNSKKLIEEASAMGYKGNTEMMYISDLYQAWFATNYD